MDQYIKTVISVGGSAIMLVMIVCVIWYVVKDTWKDINNSSKRLTDSCHENEKKQTLSVFY